MAETEKRTGGCHCGAVRYEATADLAQVIQCNCSHCSAKGFLLTFISEDQFTLLQGEERLTEYLFNQHKIRHLFCASCGVQAFARGERPDGGRMVALNVRAMEGVDLAALDPTPVDGRSF